MKKSVMLALLLAACSDDVNTDGPIVIQPPAVTETQQVEAKFKIGDIVVTKNFDGDLKIVAVLGVQTWTNSQTGEQIESITYILEAEVNGEVVRGMLPEVSLTLKK